MPSEPNATIQYEPPASVQRSDPDQQRIRPEERPTDAFQDHIQRDPTICNNCFNRRFDVSIEPFYRGEHGWCEAEYWLPRDCNLDAHADRLTKGTTTACECGMVDGGKRRPLPTGKTMEFARNLADTMAEKGITFDRERLIDEVYQRKQDPDNQARLDMCVFAPAVAESIRVAQGSPTPTVTTSGNHAPADD